MNQRAAAVGMVILVVILLLIVGVSITFHTPAYSTQTPQRSPTMAPFFPASRFVIVTDPVPVPGSTLKVVVLRGGPANSHYAALIAENKTVTKGMEIKPERLRTDGDYVDVTLVIP